MGRLIHRFFFFQWTHSILYLQLVKSEDVELWILRVDYGSICGFGYLQWVLEPMPHGYWGTILCVHVCLLLCSFITWMSTVCHYSQDTEDFHHHRIPGVALWSLYSPPPASPFLPTQFLILGNHQSCFHFYDFVISRTLHEWNHHVVYSFGRLAFLMQHNSLSTHPSCCISLVCTIFLLSSIS